MNIQFLFSPLKDLMAYRERPELFALLIYQCIAITGFTMIMPLVAVHFVTDLKMSATFVGLGLLLRQMCQQGLTFIGGLLSDRLGLKPVLCSGLFIRGIGFILLGEAETPATLMLALFLAGTGGALFEAPFQATTIGLTRPEERKSFYLLSNYLSGIFNVLSPLLALILLLIDFSVVGWVASGCFFLACFVAWRYFPNNKPAENQDKSLVSLRKLKDDKRFLHYVLLGCGFWFIAMQINITFPLISEAITKQKSSVSLFFTFSAVLTLLLQYFLVKWLQKRFQTYQLLLVGSVFFIFASALIVTAPSFFVFLLWITLFTLGYLISRPMLDILTAYLANPKELGLYAGIANISIGLGGGLGNFFGGYLYDLGMKYQLNYLTGYVFAIIGLLTIWGYWDYFRRYPELKSA